MQPAMFRTPLRPRGVALLAVGTIAAGVATLLRVAWEPFRSLFDGNVLGTSWLASLGMRAPPDGVIGAVLGAAFVVSGIGLWLLRPWAWWLAAIVGGVGLILSIGSVLWMAVFGVLLVYLVVVHEAFSKLRLTASPAVL